MHIIFFKSPYWGVEAFSFSPTKPDINVHNFLKALYMCSMTLFGLFQFFGQLVFAKIWVPPPPIRRLASDKSQNLGAFPLKVSTPVMFPERSLKLRKFKCQ